ncbi:hypothetical protein AN216_25045 [Streptomyces oceani]|uniref:Methyltransferase type 11 n=2 Tax=Streptomyces oceani TaxID=1075402 RepID=A0A1E7JRS4_9ACTN|nr:hypothetical protein AN216_25045 [Streptomyces oceani]
MLVPLYEAVYDQLRVGGGTRLLGLGCGSGLALLLAAARGASVTGTDSDVRRLALAQERLLPPSVDPVRRWDARVAPYTSGGSPLVESAPPDVVTAFDAPGHAAELAHATPSLAPGTPVALASWGPPNRCGASSLLHTTTRCHTGYGEAERVAAADPANPAEPTGAPTAAEAAAEAARSDPKATVERHGDAYAGSGPSEATNRQRLTELARHFGLQPFHVGSVACSFGYASLDSAVRGLLSTGLFDDRVGGEAEGDSFEEGDRSRAPRELARALSPHRQNDGTVWMPHLFQYVLARA